MKLRLILYFSLVAIFYFYCSKDRRSSDTAIPRVIEDQIDVDNNRINPSTFQYTSLVDSFSYANLNYIHQKDNFNPTDYVEKFYFLPHLKY